MESRSRTAACRRAIVAAVVLGVAACSQVPITGREQLSLVPEDTMIATSFQQYQAFLDQHEVIHGTPESRMVETVGRQIQHAVEQYFAEQGRSDRLDGYQWEFHLVDQPEVNAWAMPGGKVVVYAGLLPITRDRAGLAAVLGHEIAHAVARHGNERMSQQLLAQMGGQALSVALAQKPAATRELWMTAFGAGATYGVLLPYSRVQESEADHLGLIFMALAGYDPHAAVDLWRRMMESGGPKPPAILSTHPSDRQRIENIQALLPEAMRYYRPGANGPS